MTTFNTGRQAEATAAIYLQKKGFTVIEQNWRTRSCEIDIVAQKGDTIYFIEVKYRKNYRWGGGLEYITPKKLQQMQFAAELWVHSHSWQGAYEIAAIEVTGQAFTVSTFTPVA